jgi:cytoskeletal protein CcmA (bactofilin family)
MDCTSEIGATIVIRGELLAEEDVIVAGRIEGTVKMGGHRLSVSQGAQIAADVHARELVVSGQVIGSVTTVERLELQPTADVQGDVTTPVLRMAEGAALTGDVEMPKAAKPKLQLAS